MTDQPTTQLPAISAPIPRPAAWEDPDTRRSARRGLWIALLLLVVGLVAAGAAVALVLLGYLSDDWGLPVLVAAGGLAGGALAGGITMLILWIRLRGLLRAGPWVTGALTLGDGRRAELVHGRSVSEVELDVRSGSLGDPDDRVEVDVRSDGEHMVLTIPGGRHFFRAKAVD
ncbi:hypothetical protein AADG42_10975 [Ammonicoccus fulvus]|uniref:Uncharacterized protein n=1 Tax=Ammonicoccus fulvus TaxID=3138240 RepID=A0ABZ3FRK9_9ACTN